MYNLLKYNLSLYYYFCRYFNMVILYEVFGKSEILKKFLCEKEVLFIDRVMFFYLILYMKNIFLLF